MSTKNPNIMIVEDEASLLKVISEKMKGLGITPLGYFTAESAIEALEAKRIEPDAVWLDYHLPGMTGLQFVKTLKAHKEWKNIPIMIVSNSADDKTVHDALALGADKYVLKAQHRLDDLINDLKVVIEGKNK